MNKEKATLAQLVLINMPRGSTIEDANRLALKEITNFEMIASMKPALLTCTPASIYLAVKQCISDGLTLSPSAALVYLVPGTVNVGTKEKAEYINVLTYDPTANGRLSMARQSGRILDNEMPEPKFDSQGKVLSISVKFLVPSVPSPRWETVIFNESHFNKWRWASHLKNSRNKQGADNAKMNFANPNYTNWNGGIDPEFAATKAIRHGLNRRGTNMNERPNTNVQMDFKGMPAEIVNKEAADATTDAQVLYTHYEDVENTSTRQTDSETINSENL